MERTFFARHAQHGEAICPVVSQINSTPSGTDSHTVLCVVLSCNDSLLIMVYSPIVTHSNGEYSHCESRPAGRSNLPYGIAVKLKSTHSGFKLFINLIFAFLDPPLISFSLLIASPIDSSFSK